MAKQLVVGIKVHPWELAGWKLEAAANGKSVPKWLRSLANKQLPEMRREQKDAAPAIDVALPQDGHRARAEEVEVPAPEVSSRRSAQAIPTKLPLKNPWFRLSPKCESVKCGRLRVAFCGPCRKANA